jgi:hypothetical protein
LIDVNSEGALNHTMVYLGIGHNAAEGEIKIDE